MRQENASVTDMRYMLFFSAGAITHAAFEQIETLPNLSRGVLWIACGFLSGYIHNRNRDISAFLNGSSFSSAGHLYMSMNGS